MSVCVLGPADGVDRWAIRSAAAAAAAGSATTQIDVGDARPIDESDTATARAADVRVVLASSVVGALLIATIFDLPRAQPCRRIAVIAADGSEAHALFGIADMLIFSTAAFAAMLGVAEIADDVAALLPVQALLTRPNQAAVVRFGAGGAVAVWADRTLAVSGPDVGEDDGAMARFGGTIAAAVDQGIGPERALEMALAAAAPLRLAMIAP